MCCATGLRKAHRIQKLLQARHWQHRAFIYSKNTELEGSNLLEISKKFSCTPEEAAVRLYETSEGSFVLHSMEEQDLEEIAKSDYISIASDGNSLRSTGPLSSGKPHPRSYATNTRFLENIVRDKK